VFEHIGIDVGAQQLHCVGLDRDGELLDATTFAAGELGALARWAAGARVIAVDAPAQLSTRPHADDGALSAKFRLARCGEIALGREHGYWVPWVAPAEPPETGWISTGLAVYEALAGAMLIEAYPYAGFRELNGRAPLARKQTPAGARRRIELLEAAGIAAPHLEMWSHDGLDALLCGLVALQCAGGVARRAGCGHDGSAIWLPAAVY
jgi:predicted nuclease with RNAse H fold